MKKNNKGFTLAELLIVVAIIAVLVAVAIPVFNSQLEKSRKAVDQANIRSAYGEATADYLLDATTSTGTLSINDITYNWEFDTESGTMTVEVSNKGDLKSKDYQTDGLTYSGGDTFN